MTDQTVRTVTLQQMKREGRKITMLTAYDYPMALLVDRAGIDLILVGDSGGMTVLGYETTIPVTMDEMLMMTRAVTRAVTRSMVIADMPFMSYEAEPADAIRNAGRFIKEGLAHAVKVERGWPSLPCVRAIVDAGIPVMGHVGLTPQTAVLQEGLKVQGKGLDAARRILEDALALEKAGAFAIVLEAIPGALAGVITNRLTVPTIGIGAGPNCDGQVLVLHDLLGLFDRFVPKFTKRYADLAGIISDAVSRYRQDVIERRFPEAAHTYSIDQETERALQEM
ncbi:3-methyl-2-oxobutanoate hydroxymethyltransferase [Candidatus Methylomirabilis lanthanidiphila]|uniref:3-methyl-2-oxobutanoate hydroxymethyltransferase n=1 Tax=Candidatus Methylomirabilis lanthanidiphila TaxID=2211376 RepID=A0A564ZGY1_9BACT|nr:3-methyl-2-oxobutanoate hydroxymethyltransferase [Candidatus Methylomirabilis lanthanidiphila]VUZ84167.1 3-methyl-2-oxobutanoate hydroxymethyltransferase [Candidatus Methylomirabilis lanthanidiphila]